jgi:hypothetical protein
LIVVAPVSATVLNFEVTRSDGHSEGDWDKYYSNGVLQAYGDNVDFGVATTGSTPLADGANTFTLNYARGDGWTPNVTVAYSSSGTPGSPDPRTGDGIGRVNDPANPWGQADPPEGTGPGGGGVAWLDSDTGGNAAAGKFYFSFTPDPGYAVRVNSYDLINYSFGGHATDITIRKDSITGDPLVAEYVDNNVPSGPGQQYHYDLLPQGSTFYAGTVVLEVEHTTGTNWTLALDNLSFDQQVVPEPACLSLLAVGALALRRRARQH